MPTNTNTTAIDVVDVILAQHQEVAGLLNISPRTAESHKYDIMHHLQLQSTAELVRYAIRNRIIEP